MRYWVYGVARVSQEPLDPLFIEAADEEDARNHVKEMGMAVEEVEAVQPKMAQPSAGTERPESDPSSAEIKRREFAHRVLTLWLTYPLADFLVRVFRVLAVVVGCLYLLLFFLTLYAASNAAEMAREMGMTVAVPIGAALLRVILEAVLVVSVLLAVGELLRLGMIIERNTRGRNGPAK